MPGLTKPGALSGPATAHPSLLCCRGLPSGLAYRPRTGSKSVELINHTPSWRRRPSTVPSESCTPTPGGRAAVRGDCGTRGRPSARLAPGRAVLLAGQGRPPQGLLLSGPLQPPCGCAVHGSTAAPPYPSPTLPRCYRAALPSKQALLIPLPSPGERARGLFAVPVDRCAMPERGPWRAEKRGGAWMDEVVGQSSLFAEPGRDVRLPVAHMVTAPSTLS